MASVVRITVGKTIEKVINSIQIFILESVTNKAMSLSSYTNERVNVGNIGNFTLCNQICHVKGVIIREVNDKTFIAEYSIIIVSAVNFIISVIAEYDIVIIATKNQIIKITTINKIVAITAMKCNRELSEQGIENVIPVFAVYFYFSVKWIAQSIMSIYRNNCN